MARLAAELRTGGIDVPRTLLGAGPSRRLALDEARAKETADSLATQWRERAETRSAVAPNPYRVLGEVKHKMRPRGFRTATTESARAFSEEHGQALQDAIAEDATFAAAVAHVEMVREWVALVESCPICAPMDGDLATISGSFSGGAEPGEVHPHCLCSWILLVN